MALYQIPPPVRQGFKKMILLDSTQINLLSSFVKNSNVGEGYKEIAEKNYEKISLSKDDLENIVGSLFSMVDIFLNSKMSIDGFSQKFADSYGEAVKETDENNLLKLKTNLSELIPSISTSVKYTIKAKDLLTENKNNFSEARVISDIRIVYDDEIEKKEQFALVVHHLKINYFTSMFPSDEFYVSLSLSDLHELQKVIKRAIEKDSLIRTKNHELTFVDIN